MEEEKRHAVYIEPSKELIKKLLESGVKKDWLFLMFLNVTMILAFFSSIHRYYVEGNIYFLFAVPVVIYCLPNLNLQNLPHNYIKLYKYLNE